MKAVAQPVVFSFVLILATSAAGLPFNECRSYFGYKVGVPPINVTINGCDKLPCDMVRGTKVSGGMEFLYDQDLSVLKPIVTVYWLGLPINWPIYQDNGCTSLTLNECPVKANTTARYEYSLPLGPSTPLVSPLMRFEFQDSFGRTTVCCEVPIKIVDK